MRNLMRWLRRGGRRSAAAIGRGCRLCTAPVEAGERFCGPCLLDNRAAP